MDLDVVFRRDALLFALADDPQKVRRIISFIVDIQFFADILDQRLLVCRIVDSEILAVS